MKLLILEPSTLPIIIPQDLISFQMISTLNDILLLHCIDGVVIAAQCTATILRCIVLPRIWVLGREYYD